jgi:hypothetical protein
MQDINPIRRTLSITEDNDDQVVDIRRSVGIQQLDDDEVIAAQSSKKPESKTDNNSANLNTREQFAFSSLYTPESRKNAVNRGTKTSTPPVMPKLRQKKNNNIVYFFVGSVLFLFFVLYTFVFSSVTVFITPVRTNIPVEQTITIPAIDVQIGNDIIVVAASSTDSRDVPRRGESKVESKASGIIVIYNNSSTAPQKLITNTRFESKTGKIYRIAESITVPGMTGTTPGSIEATIFADSTGADYNADSAEFTVPGFKNTALYSKFTAKNKGAITGGASGTQSTVADEDIAAAHSAILAALNTKIEAEIQNKKPSDDFLYLPDATVYTTTDNKKQVVTNPKAQYTETITAKAIFVKKEYLAKRILENTNHSEEEKLTLENTSDLVFGVPAKNTSTNKDDIVFTVTGSPNFLSAIDQSKVIDRLVGVSKATFVDRMKEFPGIAEAEPHFNPFWNSHFPNTKERITIEIQKSKKTVTK